MGCLGRSTTASSAVLRRLMTEAGDTYSGRTVRTGAFRGGLPTRLAASIALALLDICSHALISGKLATSAGASFDPSQQPLA